MDAQNPPDLEATQAQAQRVLDYFTGHTVSLMIHIGDRLGLYKALHDQGALSVAELAAKTGLQERWLQEWLRQQAAAGLIEHRNHQDEERFALSPATAAILADSASPFYMAGFFNTTTPTTTLDRVAQAFHTGLGMSYEEHGVNCACTVKRMTAPSHTFLPTFLSRMVGVTERLEQGARVLDVGCGAGSALRELARTFPTCSFEGYDPSPSAIDLARRDTQQEGLTNITYHIAKGEEIQSSPRFDVVLTLDCLHDMPFPQSALQAIRGCIKEDGVFIIKDIRAGERTEENLANPLAPLLYGFSVIYCMSSALSEPGGAGLGTLGFHPTLAKAMTTAAGFTQFRRYEFEEDTFNYFYEVRP